MLESIRTANLNNANFAEKQDYLAKLGIKVYPAEDGKTLKITTAL